MSKSPSSPRLLNHVLKVITDLNESGGSNVYTIAKHVKSNLKSLDNPRNVSTQVQRALKFAVTNGIIRQRAGKYRIKEDMLDPNKACNECRRRKRNQEKRRKRRRRHGRKHASVKEITKPKSFRRYLFDDEDDDDEENGQKKRPAPVTQAKRRRKKVGGKRRRRRGSRHAPMKPKSSDDSLKGPDKDRSNEDFTKDIVYPDDHKGGEDDQKGEENNQHCDNPDCLCNIKEEANANMEHFDEN